jgi:hypothetical protein
MANFFVPASEEIFTSLVVTKLKRISFSILNNEREMF